MRCSHCDVDIGLGEPHGIGHCVIGDAEVPPERHPPPAEVLIYGMAAAHPRIRAWAAMTEAEQDEVIREARERETARSVADSKMRAARAAMFDADRRATCATPSVTGPMVGLDAMLPPLTPSAMIGEVAGFLTQAAEMAYGAGEYRLAYDIGVMARRAERTAKTKEPRRG